MADNHLANDKRINPKYFLVFIKIFIIYIFFQYVLLSFSANQVYFYFIKFLGDIMVLCFLIFTIIKSKQLKIFKEQKIALVIAFLILVIFSTIKNNLTIIDFLIGIRSLFRYYLVYFLSFYYKIEFKDFKNISNFIIKSFYIEIVLFFINYLVNGNVYVLLNHYVLTGVYLNAVCALVLFEQKFSLKNDVIILLVLVQAFLSTSRLALAGIMIQGILFIFFLWKKKIHIKVIAASGIFLLGLVLIFILYTYSSVSSMGMINKIQNTKLSEASDFRTYLFSRFTKLSIQEINLIGDGPNTFGSELNEEYQYSVGFTEETIAYSADSHYTILLMSYGFIGLILFYFMLYAFYKGSGKKYRPFLMMYLVFILIASFTAPIFSMRISSFLMFAFFSLTHNKGEVK